MTTERPKRVAQGRRWRRLVAMVVARDLGKCWCCGHYSAYSADHVVPATEDPSREWDITNLKAIHSWPKGCPDCTVAAAKLGNGPVYCNSIKSAMSVERARRIIRERTGLSMPGDVKERPERPWLQLP